MLLNLPVNVISAIQITERIVGHVPYNYGDKIPITSSVMEFIDIGSRPLASGKLHGIDCSGYIRWLLYQSSQGKVTVPDGSYYIGMYIKSKAAALAIEPEDYEGAGALDGIMRIAGFAQHGNEPGHIWCVCNGLTMESHGKNSHGNGVDRRAWDTPVLTDNVEWCFSIAAKYQFL